MQTIILLTIGILISYINPSIFNISEISYTQETEKNDVIKALNDNDLDYLFSLKMEQLENNFDRIAHDKPTKIICSDKKVERIFLEDYRCHFYFDDIGTIRAIDFFDLEKILKSEISIDNFNDVQSILGENEALSIKTEHEYGSYWSTALIYDFDKYSYLFYSDSIEGNNCNLLICKTEDKKLGEVSKIEKEFRSDLPDIIISKKDEAIYSLENASAKASENNGYRWYEIADNYIIIDIAEGDLNNDGKEDFAAVVQQENTYMLDSEELRWIYVFEQNNDGNYKLTHINKNLVLGASFGGIWGDPFSGISIENSILSVSDYGGSAWRWSHTYDFGYKDNNLILKKHIYNTAYTGTNGEEIYTYDFENGYYTLTINGTDIPPENKNKIIFQAPIENEKAYFDTFDHNLVSFNFNTPNFDSYIFYPNYPESNISAEEALDIVKNLYYSEIDDMEKVYIPWTEETKKNYSEAAGYKVPNYYYENEYYYLSYYELLYDQNSVNGEDLIHDIILKRKQKIDELDFKFYHVSDKTGKILKE